MRLRANAGLIFGLPQELFVNPSQKPAKVKSMALTAPNQTATAQTVSPSNRLKNDTIRMLIGYTPGAANGDYMHLPPVYYQNHDSSNAHGLFRSETLIEVILLSSTSIHC